MQLRAPPKPTQVKRSAALAVMATLQGLTLIAVLGGVLLMRQGPATGTDGQDVARHREVASKLKAAGATQQAAKLYEDYLASARLPREQQATIAYSLGQLHLDNGRYEPALRWFYEAEALGGGAIKQPLGEKIVHTLERLGRFHAAQAALSSHTRLEEPQAKRAEANEVVARIGKDEIYRADVLRALDDLPAELKKRFQGTEAQQDFLRKFVTDELLWRKARKLEYQDDPEVRRQHELLLKQLVVAKFVEREVLGKVAVEETDLKTFHAAHRSRYDQPETAKLRLIKVATLDRAKEIRTSVSNADSFSRLAKNHSLHAATKEKGGRLERWVARNESFLDEGDAQTAGRVIFATASGAVSDPVVLGAHAYLFFIEARRPGKERPLAQVRAQVEQDYRIVKMQAAYQEVIKQELASKEVELFPEAMAGSS